jgi:hypothetical protein
MEKPCQYKFANQRAAKAIQVHGFLELPEALSNLDIHHTHPTLVIVGGASGIGEVDKTRLKQLFIEEIAPLVQELGVAVVDGGTDAGIMQFMGQARTEICGTFPLIGVAAIGTVILPDTPVPSTQAAPLEPNHTHFILVPGTNWGDESPWISRVASEISKGFPSLTIVVNGGEITFQDVSNSLLENRPIVTLDGTGRTADQLAAAVRGEDADSRAHKFAASGKMQVIDLVKQPERLTEVMKEILSKLLSL